MISRMAMINDIISRQFIRLMYHAGVINNKKFRTMKKFVDFVIESKNQFSYDDAKRLRDLNLINEFDYLRAAKEAGLLKKFLVAAKVERNFIGSPDQREELIKDLTYELDDAIDGIIIDPTDVYIDEWTEDDDDNMFLEVIAQFDVYTELDKPQLQKVLDEQLPAMLDQLSMDIHEQ